MSNSRLAGTAERKSGLSIGKNRWFGRTTFLALLQNYPVSVFLRHIGKYRIWNVAHGTANAGSRHRMEVSHGSQSAFDAHPGSCGARGLRQRSTPAKRRFNQCSPASARQLGTGESDKPTGCCHRQPGDSRGATHVISAEVAVASAGPREVLGRPSVHEI
jgi:hypothetical protein